MHSRTPVFSGISTSLLHQLGAPYGDNHKFEFVLIHVLYQGISLHEILWS